MKISRTLPLVAALLLAGCDEGPQLPESLGQVEGAPTFRLPGPVYRLETVSYTHLTLPTKRIV